MSSRHWDYTRQFIPCRCHAGAWLKATNDSQGIPNDNERGTKWEDTTGRGAATISWLIDENFQKQLDAHFGSFCLLPDNGINSACWIRTLCAFHRRRRVPGKSLGGAFSKNYSVPDSSMLPFSRKLSHPRFPMRSIARRSAKFEIAVKAMNLNSMDFYEFWIGKQIGNFLPQGRKAPAWKVFKDVSKVVACIQHAQRVFFQYFWLSSYES